MTDASTMAPIAEEITALLEGRRMKDPWPVWTQAREEAPAHLLPARASIMITRYEDVRTMMFDTDLYSNAYTTSGTRVQRIMESLEPDVAEMFRQASAFEGLMMSRSDDPLHARLRAITHRFFTPKYVRDLEPVIQGFVDELLAEAAESGEPFDNKVLSQDFALRVMTHIIGTPQVERHLVRHLSDRIALALGSGDPDIIKDAYDAREEFNAYIEEHVIAAHRRDPGSNELAAAMQDASAGDTLSHTELVAMVANLLFGGLETTSSLLTSGLIELLEHRSEWERLVADPALTPGAVEELMRFTSPAQYMSRIARVDHTIGGVEVEQGQTMLGAIAAANRDPRMFEDPDRLDITRKIKQHLALAIGPHYCLGASLIRLEARVYFATLAQRHPGIELAVPVDELEWFRSNPILRAVNEMPMHLG